MEREEGTPEPASDFCMKATAWPSQPHTPKENKNTNRVQRQEPGARSQASFDVLCSEAGLSLTMQLRTAWTPDDSGCFCLRPQVPKL